METFKRALAFIALLGGIILGAEIFVIVRNEYISYRYESELLNDWISFFVIAGIYGTMVGIYVYIGTYIDKIKASKTLKRREEDETHFRNVRAKIIENILAKLSNDELKALLKNKELVNFHFLIAYNQEIKIPQEQFLNDIKEIIKNKP